MQHWAAASINQWVTFGLPFDLSPASLFFLSSFARSISAFFDICKLTCACLIMLVQSTLAGGKG